MTSLPPLTAHSAFGSRRRGLLLLLVLLASLPSPMDAPAQTGGPARDAQGGLGRRLEPSSASPDASPVSPSSEASGDPVAATASATRPSTLPAAQPDPRVVADAAAREARLQEKTKFVFDHLMKEYKGILVRNKDRLGRSLAIVCMARIPRADATAELLALLKGERDPLVRMVCWQSLLARANGLSEAEYRQWVALTQPLIDANFFRGDLRVALLRLLAIAPPDAKARDAFARIFANTNSMDAQDYPTLLALGETMKAWGDPVVVESVLARLGDINDAQRAEVVLHAAGANVAYSVLRRDLGSSEMWKKAGQDYTEWWKQQKPSWTMRGKTEPGEWQRLPAQYVPRVDMAGTVDPDDKTWYRDLEIRPPALRTFTVGLVVDTTGSMGRVLVWLRSDVRRITEALGVVALEPQISITFYRDHGDAFLAKTLPLTGKVESLTAALAAIDARGGGDVPEAVREGLLDALSASKWPTSPKHPKAIVLIGDAPPHPQTQAECERIIGDAAARGFRLYTVKVRTGWEAEDLSAFDKLAAAGNGTSLWADMRLGQAQGDGTGKRMVGKGDGIVKRGLGPEALRRMTSLGKAASAADETPGEWIVTRVLIDAVNPQFGDRVRPPVGVLWQLLKNPTKETHQPFPPPPPPHPGRGPKLPKPPFDPQRQR